jgi:hypothetical protein
VPTTPYSKDTSPLVRGFAANLIALGDAWKGTAPPIRLLGWTVTWVLVATVLMIAARVGIAPPHGIDSLLEYAKHW